MKQFNLDEYIRLKEEGKEPRIVTGKGDNVRILCTDCKGKDYPIVALWESGEDEMGGFFTANGIYLGSYGESNRDLFFADMEEEPKYRPFKDAEECFNEVKRHGGWMMDPTTEDRICITWVRSDHIRSGGIIFDFAEIVKSYIWTDDNAPCGIKED